jgi:hypothetical protein
MPQLVLKWPAVEPGEQKLNVATHVEGLHISPLTQKLNRNDYGTLLFLVLSLADAFGAGLPEELPIRGNCDLVRILEHKFEEVRSLHWEGKETVERGKVDARKLAEVVEPYWTGKKPLP